MAYILGNLSYANQHVGIIYEGIILSAPGDYDALGYLLPYTHELTHSLTPNRCETALARIINQNTTYLEGLWYGHH